MAPFRKPALLAVTTATIAVFSASFAEAPRNTAPAADEGVLRVNTASGRPSGEAAAFVAAESPANAFVFAPDVPGRAGKPVIAHYFPPFPLTIGGRAPAKDYYARNYLRAEGENGKFARGGGFMRERPLPGPESNAQWRTDFATQVARASRVGIDAFGIDILQLGGQSESALRGMLDAARTTDPRFRLVIEPDMGSLRKVTAAELAAFVLKYADHPAMLRTAGGDLIVMPFSAERRDVVFWKEFKAAMARKGQRVALVPDFVSTAASAQLASISAAGAMWGSRALTAGETQQRFAGDAIRRGYPGWVATAAPQDMRPKSLMVQEAGGSLSFTRSLQVAIAGKAAALHLVTWNDYSEGSELAPSSVTRFAYYDLAAYYIAWFKTGEPPRITRDGFIGLHRRQIFRPADRSRGEAWNVRGGAPVDIVEMTAFLTRPAELVITSGGKTTRRSVESGVQRVTAPALPGPVTMSVMRGGKTVASCKSPWVIEDRPTRHDPLYAGFSSLRGCN